MRRYFAAVHYWRDDDRNGHATTVLKDTGDSGTMHENVRLTFVPDDPALPTFTGRSHETITNETITDTVSRSGTTVLTVTNHDIYRGGRESVRVRGLSHYTLQDNAPAGPSENDIF